MADSPMDEFGPTMVLAMSKDGPVLVDINNPGLQWPQDYKEQSRTVTDYIEIKNG